MALDTQIEHEFTQFASDTQRVWGSYFREAREDLNFYAGQLLSAQEVGKLSNQNRNSYQVNKIRRVINQYSGYERENRVSTVIGSTDETDDQTAEQLSDCMLYAYDKGDAHINISDAFDHSLKTGLSVIGVAMDFSRDRVNGDIKFWWKPYNAVLIDPYFTKRNLDDAERCATRDMLDKEQVKQLLPFVDPKEIDSLPTGVTDNKFPQYILNLSNTTSAIRNLVTYDQYWVRSSKTVRLLIDTTSGEEIDVTDFEEEEIQILLSQFAENDVQVVKTSKETVTLHIIVGGRLLYSGPDATGIDTFPFRPMIPFFEPYTDRFDLRIQGVVRSQKDPQRLYNRRMNQITDWLESKVHTGFKVVNGAVQDPNMLFQTGQARLIVVNQGFDPTRDVQQLDASDLPPNVLQHMQMLDKDILEVSGVTETQLGTDEGGNTQVSGRLAEVRASHGMTGSRGIFDVYEYTLKELGRVVLETIQKNYTPEKVERITNKQPTDQFNSRIFQQYDTNIKQAVLTKTQRDTYYYELLRLRELGIEIPDSEIIKSVPIQSRDRLNQLIEEQEQQAQIAMQKQQEAEERMNELMEARTAGEIARTEAETARSKSQTGLLIERIARANEDSAGAALDRAKALTEIENLQTDQLLKMLQFLQILENPVPGAQANTKTTEATNVQRTISPSGERTGKVLDKQAEGISPTEGVELT